MTKYLADIPPEIWKAFKIVCALQGLKVKEGILEAVEEYIKTHQSEHVAVSFKVVEEKKKNLLTFIYEIELKNLLTELVSAQKRNAPRDYMDSIKNRLQEIVKKHPTLPPALAEEIKAVFQTIS